MMKAKRLLPVITALLLGGCGYTGDLPAEAYRHYGDRLKVYLGGALGQPCMENGRRVMAPSQCYVWGKSQRYQGILLTYGWRSPDFIPNVAQPPKSYWAIKAYDAMSDTYRMGYRLGDQVTQPWKAGNGAKAYRITFTGRQTTTPPRSYPDEIILIEHIDSIQRVPWKPED